MSNLYERLTQYENTGLSPFEVVELIKIKDEFLESLKDAVISMQYALNYVEGNGLNVEGALKESISEAKAVIAKAIGEESK